MIETENRRLRRPLPGIWRRFAPCAATRGERRSVRIVAPENAPSLRLARKLGYKGFGQIEYHGAPVTMLERIPGWDGPPAGR